MKTLKSIRGKLFFWYATSLFTITAYFYLAVHIFSLPYGNIVFVILLLILALEGFVIIRRMTNELTKLSSKIKTITSENLNKKITEVTSEDEIGELADSFNNLLDRLHGSFQREWQFIGDVAHELKTPLAILQTNTEVTLSRERTKEEYKKALIETRIDTQRIAAMLKNILDLAWSEADQAISLKETVHLSSVLEELKEIAMKLASSKQIAVEGNIEDGILVHGKEDKLSRALLNIIDNAINYTPQKGTVTLSLHAYHHKAVIHIKDTGRGIAPKDLPHIFERFYRGEKTGKTFGSGLGMAIAKATVTAHNGTIDIVSKQKKGATVTISLPLSQTPN